MCTHINSTYLLCILHVCTHAYRLYKYMSLHNRKSCTYKTATIIKPDAALRVG